MARNRRNLANRTSWQPKGSRRRVVSGRLVGFLLLLVAIAAVGAYFAVFSPLLWEQQVNVKGAKTISQDAVVRAAEDAAEQHFGPISTRSLVLVNTGAVADAIKRKHDDIAAIEVTKRWPNGLDVDITERQSTLLWQSHDGYYLVDGQGIAFDKATPQEKLIKVEDSAGLPVELGKRVASARFIKALQDIRRDMATAGLKVTGFRIPESTFEVQAITDQGYYALFDTTRSASFQVDALKRAVEKAKPKEYADLQVPGRVYVK